MSTLKYVIPPGCQYFARSEKKHTQSHTHTHTHTNEWHCTPVLDDRKEGTVL